MNGEGGGRKEGERVKKDKVNWTMRRKAKQSERNTEGIGCGK